MAMQRVIRRKSKQFSSVDFPEEKTGKGDVYGKEISGRRQHTIAIYVQDTSYTIQK